MINEDKVWNPVEAACLGKEGYDRATAGRVARKAKAPLKTFKCPHCGMWHVGTPLGVSPGTRKRGTAKLRRKKRP